MKDKNADRIEVFNRDAASNQGYLYTTNTRLSSQLATRRSMEAIMRAGGFCGRSVLDVGCGDGWYTIQYWDTARPGRLVGLDAAAHSIKVAKTRKGDRPIEFMVGDAHKIPYPDRSFDLVMLQSILHHDDDPLASIREAFRLGRRVLIHEPNGSNLGLKVIERISRYHREHLEKSYTRRRFARWISQAGGVIERDAFAGFVPMFCPDWLARGMKAIEPLVEKTPLLRCVACAVYVVVAVRVDPAEGESSDR